MRIGDTLRVSLAAEPEEEIPVVYEILRALELRTRGVTFVSCPSCGRGRGIICRKGHVIKTVPESQFLEEVLREIASILPPHEVWLVYPGGGTLGPVSHGRTRQTGIHHLPMSVPTGSDDGAR